MCKLASVKEGERETVVSMNGNTGEEEEEVEDSKVTATAVTCQLGTFSRAWRSFFASLSVPPSVALAFSPHLPFFSAIFLILAFVPSLSHSP